MKHRSWLLTALTVFLALNLVSCGADSYAKESASDGGAWNSSPAYTAEYEMYEDAEWGASAPTTSTANSSGSSQSSTGSNDLNSRKIIKRAHLTYETTDYEEFLESLNACIASYGGYVENAENYGGGEYSYNYSRHGYMTVRIPANAYNAFMETVSAFGALIYRSENSEDVTMTYVDIESHIRALETEYNSLLQILEKAESLEDVLLLQSRISEVNYQLDSYKSQIRKYDDLISYCTVTIDVNEVYRQTTPNEHRLTFGEKISVGLRENLLDIGEGFSDFAVWFVTSLPYILIWAVIIVAVIFIIRALVRSWRRKRDKKLIEAYLKTHPASNETTEEKKIETNS